MLGHMDILSMTFLQSSVENTKETLKTMITRIIQECAYPETLVEQLNAYYNLVLDQSIE